MESIGAQLWLVAYDVGRGAPRGGRNLAYAITGGLLCDLQLRGKIGPAGGFCRVLDPTSLGCPALDDLLSRIVADTAALRPPRTWLGWLRGYAKEASTAVVEELEEHGRLVRYERRVLGVLALPRHSLADPTRADRLASTIRDTLCAAPGTQCEVRVATLSVLAAATGGMAGRLAVRARAAELEGMVPPGVAAVLTAVRAAQLDVAVPVGAAG